MRNLKRVLSMALASVMVLGLTVVGASAANFNDQAEIKHTTAAAVMNAIGVLEGNEKGDFMPDQVLTREQAAKIITYMLMGPENAEKLGASGTKFSDVAADRWSAPYIAYCANMGILAGDGTGKFNPEGELTGHAFAKMLLVALGYDATVQNYVGNSWAINVATDAVNAGIFVSGTVLSDPLSRDNAAQMAFQTLTADMVQYDNKGSIIELPGGGQIVSNPSSAKKVPAAKKDGNDSEYVGYKSEKNDEYKQFCEQYFTDLKKVSTTSDDGLKRPAVIWEYDDEDIVTVVDSADKTLAVNDSDYGSYQVALQKALDDSAAKINYTETNKLYVNGEKVSDTTAPKIGDVMYVYETSTKDTYDVYVGQYTFAFVDEIDTSVSSKDEKAGVKSYVTLTDITGTKKLATDVKDTDFAGFAYNEGDAVAVILDGDKVLASYALDSVEGKITAYDKSYVRVDGTKYELSGKVDNEAGTDYSFDETYTLYTDANGYVLGIKGTAGTATLDDVYYVAKIYTEETTSYGKSTYNSYAQSVALDGTVEEILIEKDSEKNYQGNVDGNKTKAEEGKLYTFSANANDSKVNDPKLYDGGKNYDVFDAASITTNGTEDKANDGSLSFTSSTTRVNGAKAGERAYTGKNTQYVLVEGTGSDLKVKTYTGSVRVGVKNAIAIANSSDDAVYVILVANKTASVTEEDSLVYIASVDGKVSNGYEVTAYDMKGSEVKDLVIEKNLGTGLFSYAVNEDGVYTDLQKVSNSAIVDNEGYAVGATFAGLYRRTLVSFKYDGGSKTMVDVEAGEAKVIDLRDDFTDPYDREINSLDRLNDAYNDGKNTVTMTLYMNDQIQVIFVTDVDVKPTKSNDATIKSATAAEATDTDAGMTVTETAAVNTDGSTGTIKVTATGGNATDTITVTVVKNHAKATVDHGTVTLTNTDGTWDTQTITVTAEDGETTVTYTVSVVAE